MATITASSNQVTRMQYLQIDGVGFTPNTTADIYIAAGSQLFLLQGVAALTATGSFSVPVLFGDNLPIDTVFVYAKDTSGVQSPSIAIQVTGTGGSDSLSGNNTGGGNEDLSTWQEVQKTIKPFLPWIAALVAFAIVVIILKNKE